MNWWWGISGRGKAGLGIALACLLAVGLAAVVIARGAKDKGSEGSTGRAEAPVSAGGSDSPPGGAPGSPASPQGGPGPHTKLAAQESSRRKTTRHTVRWVSNDERVRKHEALPCTGAKQPINFEIFSAGPKVAGVPMNSMQRRCGGTTPIDEPPANYVNYIYGDCEVSEGASSCVPSLEIQTWPACQRSLADYTFAGKPMPYRRLKSAGGAEVVEIQFEFEPRFELYTGTSTIVIFTEDPALAEAAIAALQSQQAGDPPATTAGELEKQPDGGLAPPSDGATEGELSC